MSIEWTNILISVIGTVIGAFAVNWYTREYNYDHLFAETVSKSRMHWIDNFREEFATFIGYIQALGAEYDKREKLADSDNLQGNCNKNDCKLFQLIA